MIRKFATRVREFVKSIVMIFVCRFPLRQLDTTKIIHELTNGGGGSIPLNFY